MPSYGRINPADLSRINWRTVRSPRNLRAQTLRIEYRKLRALRLREDVQPLVTSFLPT